MTVQVARDEHSAAATTYPPADVERRFLAFTIDRALAWGLYAGAGWLAWWLFWREGEVWSGVGVLVAAVLVVTLGPGALLGATGLSAGKGVMGLRLLGEESQEPVGVGPAVLRSVVLGLATLPTFGLGVATLAWTATMDPTGRRRGWHDVLTGSVVVDTRPRPEPEADEAEAPRQIVNLTAMRLVPAPVTPAGPATPVPSAQPQPSQQSQPAVEPAVRAAVQAAQPVVQPAAPQPAQPAQPAAPQSAQPAAPPSATSVPDGARGRHRGGAGASTDPGGGRAPAPGVAEQGWRVVFDTGETVDVAGLVLVGRKPEPRPGEPVRHVVALRSTDMSLSKTHAQLHLADGVLVVTDRGSTNGSVLNRRGVARDLAPGRPTTLVDGDLVRFGDREMQVTRRA